MDMHIISRVCLLKEYNKCLTLDLNIRVLIKKTYALLNLLTHLSL